jgi:hypothetical protein
MSEISKVKLLRDLMEFLQASQVNFALKSVKKRKNSVFATVEVAEAEAGFFLVYLCEKDYLGVDFSCSPLPEGCIVEISFPIGFFEY